jgi:hypothetical protein
VVGHVAASVGLHELGPDDGGVDEDVGALGVHPEREHVRMLEEQEMVVSASIVQGALERVRLFVGDPAQPSNPEHAYALFLSFFVSCRVRALQPNRGWRAAG